MGYLESILLSFAVPLIIYCILNLIYAGLVWGLKPEKENKFTKGDFWALFGFSRFSAFFSALCLCEMLAHWVSWPAPDNPGATGERLDLYWPIFFCCLFLILCVTIILILGYIGEVYKKRIAKWVKKARKHWIKYSSVTFSFFSAIVTVVAVGTSMYTVQTYHLSPDVIILNIGKAIYSIVFFALTLTLLIAYPAFFLWTVKKDEQKAPAGQKTDKVAAGIGHGLMLLIITATTALMFSITARPFVFIPNQTVMTVLSSVIWGTYWITLTALFIFRFLHSSNARLKRFTGYVCYGAFAVGVILVIMFLASILFTPHTAYRQYEYIQTEEYGDCIILMRNGTQYILESFTFDEERQEITVYNDKYYTVNLNAAEMKKITYKEFSWG